MKQNLQKYIPLVTLPLVVVVCLLLWPLTATTGYINVYSEDGVWDLRDFDFEAGYARLLGPVEYIPEALLAPDEFDARSGEALLGHPQNDSPAQFVTSRQRILLPEGAAYAVACRSVDFSERLFAGGLLMDEVGMPGETKESTVPDTDTHYFTATPVDGELVIVRQAANFVHRESGWHDGLRIGYPKFLQDSYRQMAYTIIMGCYLALFVVHLALYFVLRGYPANLFFSLFCLVWFFRTGMIESKVLSTLAPSLPWVVKFRIEYLSLPLAAILLIAMLNQLFPGILARWFRLLAYAVSGVFCGLFLFTGTLFMSKAMPVLYVFCALFALLVVVFFALRLRKPSLIQIVSLLGAGLFIYAGLRDMLFYNHFLPSFFTDADLSKIAMLVFVFFQMTAMFMGTVHTAEEARAAEQRLATENAALDRLQRLKSDLLATISHETRTPLAVLSGYADVISMEMRKKGVDDQTAHDLSRISSEAQRLADIMEEMQRLSGARDAAAHKAPTALSEIILSAARLYTPILARQHTTLETDIETNLPPVYANAGELTQVLFNLLANARNHTENGAVTIRLARDGDALAVTVADTGSGIPPELLPHIFERGVSGGAQGSGIGLAICKEIVEGHGGGISLKSEPGKGTAVTFTLPIYTGEKEDARHERNHLIG